MIHRLSIANLEPQDLAKRLAEHGLSGTVVSGVGFTPEWGIEPSAVAILAGEPAAAIHRAARAILGDTGESAAYLDNGETAWLIWPESLEVINA